MEPDSSRTTLNDQQLDQEVEKAQEALATENEFSDLFDVNAATQAQEAAAPPVEQQQDSNAVTEAVEPQPEIAKAPQAEESQSSIQAIQAEKPSTPEPTKKSNELIQADQQLPEVAKAHQPEESRASMKAVEVAKRATSETPMVAMDEETRAKAMKIAMNIINSSKRMENEPGSLEDFVANQSNAEEDQPIEQALTTPKTKASTASKKKATPKGKGSTGTKKNVFHFSTDKPASPEICTPQKTPRKTPKQTPRKTPNDAKKKEADEKHAPKKQRKKIAALIEKIANNFDVPNAKFTHFKGDVHYENEALNNVASLMISWHYINRNSLEQKEKDAAPLRDICNRFLHGDLGANDVKLQEEVVKVMIIYDHGPNYVESDSEPEPPKRKKKSSPKKSAGKNVAKRAIQNDENDSELEMPKFKASSKSTNKATPKKGKGKQSIESSDSDFEEPMPKTTPKKKGKVVPKSEPKDDQIVRKRKSQDALEMETPTKKKKGKEPIVLNEEDEDIRNTDEEFELYKQFRKMREGRL